MACQKSISKSRDGFCFLKIKTISRLNMKCQYQNQNQDYCQYSWIFQDSWHFPSIMTSLLLKRYSFYNGNLDLIFECLLSIYINHKHWNPRSVVMPSRPNRWTDFQKWGTMWKPCYCWVFVNRFHDHICSGLLSVVKGLWWLFGDQEWHFYCTWCTLAEYCSSCQKIKNNFSIFFIFWNFADIRNNPPAKLWSNWNVFSGILVGSDE